MAKIREYPILLNPHADDTLLVSDSQDGEKTKLIKFSTISTTGSIVQPTGYKVLMPSTVGSAGQVLALPTPLGTSPYQLVWSNSSSGSSSSSTTADSSTISADSSTVTADAA
tara:strand:+ start:926 stop:1261 length:336 start_codon:yes stop_codon:yes gene_type:complete